ncbi:MAG TPA: hypothetical protein VFH53_00645 [Phycisphaerae bacterium]|nr:hypothetical protein [Phycisphaerae bacterium]
MTYRNTASFGKRQEYSVVAELLRHGFDVYMTLVDDQGIDCVVRLDATRYVDVQIKARSKDAKQWSTFAAMDFEPRPNLFFIFYTEKNATFWTIPSLDLAGLCHRNASGRNAGRRTLVLPKTPDGEKAKRFAKYTGNNGFGLLRAFAAGT